MSLDTPCEVVGVTEIQDGVLVPFIVVRMRNEAVGREKFLLKTGETVSWEVELSPVACSLAPSHCTVAKIILSEILPLS